MPDKSSQRRLAAILAADVAGYSSLVREDEDGTLAAFRSHLTEHIEPTLARFNGRLFKIMGDGLLAEFTSVVEAVQCAVVIQQGMTERNLDLCADRRLEFRIGINLGDVVVQDDDVFGDGVNVAARLEGLAEPGGICISRSARDQVRDKLNFGLVDWGEVEIKNISRPVRVFQVLPDSEDAGKTVQRQDAAINRRWLPAAAILTLLLVVFVGIAVWQPWSLLSQGSIEARLPDRPSIAVLPFESLSQDKEQEFFADGMTEDIIIGLSKVSGLFVIARNSTFAYKGKRVEVKQAADELGVRNVLTGSVRRAGDRLRITAQLVDAMKGNALWGDQYDRKVTDVFSVQSEIGQHVVKALSVTLKANEQERLFRTHTNSIPAYELFLKARKAHLIANPSTLGHAADLYKQIVKLDPNFAGGYAGQAFVLSVSARLGFSDDRRADALRALELANKAVAIDPEFGWGYIALGGAQVVLGDADAAVSAVQRAVDLQPNDADALLFLGFYKAYAGHPASGIENIKVSMLLDPKPNNRQYFFLGNAYLVNTQYEEAVGAFEKWDELSPNPVGLVLLAASYALAGNENQARLTASRYLAKNPNFSASAWKFLRNFKKPEHRDLILKGMKKAGFPDRST